MSISWERILWGKLGNFKISQYIKCLTFLTVLLIFSSQNTSQTILSCNHVYGFLSAWFNEIKDECLRITQSLPTEIFPINTCIYLFWYLMFKMKSIPSHNYFSAPPPPRPVKQKTNLEQATPSFLSFYFPSFLLFPPSFIPSFFSFLPSFSPLLSPLGLHCPPPPSPAFLLLPFSSFLLPSPPPPLLSSLLHTF